jgi:4-azaleucine resistance transporter AzlC
LWGKRCSPPAPSFWLATIQALPASRPAKPAFGGNRPPALKRTPYDRRMARVEGFRRGFVAMVPLWLGVVPFGVVYAVLARDAGLSLLETQSLSVLVFAGSAQVSAVGLFGTGAAALEIVSTTFLLNVRHVLYGLSLGRRIPLHGWRRPTAAYFLTDEAFGVTVAGRERTFAFLLGTELSLFAVWNLATLGGAVAGTAISDPARLGIDLVFPLAFLALLVPLVRTRVELGVAVASGVLAYVLAEGLPGGLPILVTGVAGSLLGAALTGGHPDDTVRLEDAAREVA